MTRLLALPGLAVGAAALLLRLVLTVQERLAAGDGPFEAVVFYLSFFTILVNLGVVLVYASDLVSGLRWFRRQWVRSMHVVLMLVVMGTFALLIDGNYEQEGLVLLADTTTHYVTPPLFLLWWVAAARHEVPRLTDVWRMVLPPLLYAGYMLLRGAMTGFYPYPFLDPTRLGALGLAASIAGFAAVMMPLFAIAILIDRRLASARPARP